MKRSVVSHHNVESTRVLVKLLALSLVLFSSAASAVPQIFTVTNTADAGAGSLRQAILDANENTGADTIAFNIPGSDSGCNAVTHVCTIKPTAANAATWPRVTSPVTIDGYSQPGAQVNSLAVGDNAALLVELDATNLTDAAIYLAGPFSGGDSTGSTIKGIVLSHIKAPYGICSSCNGGGSNNHTISGNFIGTDATGTATTSSGNGIQLVGSTGSIIGGTAPDARNVISTSGEAILLDGSTNTTVQGNYIGTDKTGTVALASGRGIDVTSNSSGSLIGGATAGAGNVVGSWSDFGIIVQNGNDNRIQGNLIGTDATGTVRLGGQIGVEYAGSGTGNKIGGTGAGEGNVIDGATTSAVELFFDGSPDLLVQGNFIGTDITGAVPLGNAQGILVYDGKGIVGGTAAGAGNRIAFNSTSGVSIFATSKNVPILGNEIYANGGLGITLSGTSIPIDNDDGDADPGNNLQQNYPVISTVTINPKTTAHVAGSLNSAAGTAFRIEFFANANCDGAGHGEGKHFIGFANVTTTPNPVSFGTPLTLDFTVPADRHVITATATDPAGNTSEFSACSTQDTIFSDGLDGD